MPRPTRISTASALLSVLAGALSGACAPLPKVSGAYIAVPASVRTIFVGTFAGSHFNREMRDAMMEALQESGRFQVVANSDGADALMTGAFGAAANTTPVVQRPVASVQLVVRESGRVVWQYQYRDQQSGAEMVAPTPMQQVRGVARQFVAQLLRVSAAPS